MFGVGRLALGVALSVFFTMLVIVVIKRVSTKYNVPFVASIAGEV